MKNKLENEIVALQLRLEKLEHENRMLWICLGIKCKPKKVKRIKKTLKKNRINF